MVWIVELEGVDSLYMHRLLSHFLFCRKVVKYICTNIFGILESTCESRQRQGHKGVQVGGFWFGGSNDELTINSAFFQGWRWCWC